MEYQFHPFDKIHVTECMNPHLIRAQLFLWACSLTGGSTEGKSIIGFLTESRSLRTAAANVNVNFYF